MSAPTTIYETNFKDSTRVYTPPNDYLVDVKIFTGYPNVEIAGTSQTGLIWDVETGGADSAVVGDIDVFTGN